MPRGGSRAGSGRPRGARNRRTVELIGKLAAMGCDPAEQLARLAAEAEAAGNLDLAVRAYAALMPYRWPRLAGSSKAEDLEKADDPASVTERISRIAD
jgi:predicted TPR repeat methyltransferase